MSTKTGQEWVDATVEGMRAVADDIKAGNVSSDSVVPMVQVTATLAVAEALLEIRDEIERLAGGKL